MAPSFFLLVLTVLLPSSSLNDREGLELVPTERMIASKAPTNSWPAMMNVISKPEQSGQEVGLVLVLGMKEREKYAITKGKIMPASWRYLSNSRCILHPSWAAILSVARDRP